MTDPKKEEENPKRFLPQCFMMEFYRDFVKKNLDITYSSYCKINVEPAKAINSIMNKKVAFAINDLTPAQLSRLVPKFRLFKLYNDAEPKEFTFDSHTTLFDGPTNTFSKHKDLVLKPTKKPMSVGFKSFRWEDLGTNPANQGLSFKASLSLVCPNMQSLFRKVNGLAFDELICPASRQSSSPNPIYDGKENRMRADVGWALPASFTNAPELWGSDKKMKEIKEAIRASQVSLFLNLVSHELSINEDGTIELSIEFMASLESALSSPSSNLFALGKTENAQVALLERRIEIAEKQRSIQVKEVKRLCGPEGENCEWHDYESEEIDLAQEQVKNYGKKIEELKKELAALQDSQAGVKYEALLERMTEKGRFFYIDLSPQEIEAMQELNKLYTNPNLTPTELLQKRTELLKRLKLNKGLNGTFGKGDKKNQTFDISKEYKEASKRKADVGAAGVVGYNNRAEHIQEKVVEGGQEALSKTRKGKDVKRINYMYFGDLFEAALGIVRQNQRKEGDKQEWRYLLGMIELYDPDLKKNVCVNIADLPVCWEYFQSFFLDKVIKPTKKKWNIRTFLKDVISELLIGSLSPTCFGKLKPDTRTKINIQTLILPGSGGRCSDSPFPVGGVNYPNVDGAVQWNGTKESKSYLFVYPKGGITPGRSGDYEKDRKDNIIHLQIGADRGILKSVAFKRQDMPGQREANIKKTVDGGGEVGNLLFSNRYNADLTLIGNTLFTNGSTLYLDPRGLGIGGLNQANSMAKKLGVGGYYFVKKVDYIIEPGKFETNISTVLQGLGNGKDEQDASIKEDQNFVLAEAAPAGPQPMQGQGGFRMTGIDSDVVAIDANTTKCG